MSKTRILEGEVAPKTQAGRECDLFADPVLSVRLPSSLLQLGDRVARETTASAMDVRDVLLRYAHDPANLRLSLELVLDHNVWVSPTTFASMQEAYRCSSD